LFTAACSSSAPGEREAAEAPEPTESSAAGEPESESTPPESTLAEPSEAAPATAATGVTEPGDTEPGDDDSCPVEILTTRVDIRPDGNRIAEPVDLTRATRRTIELPHRIDWLLPDPAPTGGWFAFDENGRSTRIETDGSLSDAAPANTVPPIIGIDSPFPPDGVFDDPLPDGRMVTFRNISAVLASPTDRYGHAVLGDAIEAAAIEWVHDCTGERGRIAIAEPDVIEGIAPMLANLDDDPAPEILVTLSNASTGARLAAFNLDGSLVGESEPIGRGNRWRNQLAIGPFGPDGGQEIVDVRTPHIGGTVQAFAVEDGELILTAASTSDYTSHVLGLRNLEMGIALDANDDFQLDVVVASARRDRIVALTRTWETDTGWQVLVEHELAGQISSNLVTQNSTLAVGSGSTLNLFEAP